MPAEHLYHHDPRLLTFTARVTDVREFARRDGKQVWQVALDRTAFYPAGGGQPCDLGTLTARARSGASLCLQVEDVSTGDEGEVWHTTAKPLLAGTAVEGAIDGARRLDHMQQHSGQHLLSAILADQFGTATIAFHLGAIDTTIDLECEDPARQAALAAALPQVERRVHEAIKQNLPVTVEQVPRAQAEHLLAQGHLRKLPPVEGAVRLVRMGHAYAAPLDLNACGGTHVAATGEIGAVLLRETERVKRALRLHFVCGQRAVASARATWEQLSAAAAELACGRDRLAEAVSKQSDEVRRLLKEREHLQQELAQRHAADLAAQSSNAGLLTVHFAEHDAAYIRLLASAVCRLQPAAVVLFTSARGEAASLLLAAGSQLHGGCGTLLREALAQHGLRGGGSPELAQVTLPHTALEAVARTLHQAVQQALAAKG